MLQNRKIGKKSWQIVVIRQICQSFFPSKVFYCTVYISLPTGITIVRNPSNADVCLGNMVVMHCGYTGVDPYNTIPNWIRTI